MNPRFSFTDLEAASATRSEVSIARDKFMSSGVDRDGALAQFSK